MYKKNQSAYTLKEEIISSIIHGVGIFLSIAILSVLVTLSAVYGNVYSIVSTAIFGFSMLLMYSASTLYHAIPFEGAKKILKKFDIYIKKCYNKSEVNRFEQKNL